MRPPMIFKVSHSRAKTDDEIATRRMNCLSFVDQMIDE